jgi:hypothetical protein
MADLPTLAYLGREICGCVLAVAIDEPARLRDNARELKQWARWGLQIERATAADAIAQMPSGSHPAGPCCCRACPACHRKRITSTRVQRDGPPAVQHTCKCGQSWGHQARHAPPAAPP